MPSEENAHFVPVATKCDPSDYQAIEVWTGLNAWLMPS